MARITKVKPISMDDLVIGKGQVRLRETGRDIATLAESIAKIGLLEPIVVAPAKTSGKWEIITGQRRYLAHRQLQKTEILAAILDEEVDEMEAKVLSLTENLVRLDLNSKDVIDVCTALYKKYGTIKAVAEETGLNYGIVAKYVKYDRLIPELRDLVDSGKVAIPAAIRAQDAASVSGSVNPHEAVAFAQEMRSMSGAQQKRIVADRHEEPDKPAADVIEEAKSGTKVVQVVVTLGAMEHKALQSLAKQDDISQDEAAATLITDGLQAKGLLS